MKRKILMIVIVIIMIVSICVYYNIKENQRIDAEAVTLVEDLTIEFGKKAKVSDFIENLNGTLLNDDEINTEQLGEIEVSFDYTNIKNKHRTAHFTITTTDVTPPQIFSGSSYTLPVDSDKKLTDVLISGDDIDDNPTREIIGDYDLSTVRRL